MKVSFDVDRSLAARSARRRWWLAQAAYSLAAPDRACGNADTHRERSGRQRLPAPPCPHDPAERAGQLHDTLARVLAARMGDVIGQQLVIENQAGAEG